jgi:hypothetical protein
MKSDEYKPPTDTAPCIYVNQRVTKGSTHAKSSKYFRATTPCFAEDEVAAMLVLDSLAIRYLGTVGWIKVVGVSLVPYSGPKVASPLVQKKREMYYYDADSTRDLAKFLIEHRQRHGMLAPIPTVMTKEERKEILRKLKDAQKEE